MERDFAAKTGRFTAFFRSFAPCGKPSRRAVQRPTAGGPRNGHACHCPGGAWQGCAGPVQHRAILKKARRSARLQAGPHDICHVLWISGRHRRDGRAPSACSSQRPAISGTSPAAIGVGARAARSSSRFHRRNEAPEPKKICPLPAHGRATSRMKKIKQRQYQRTISRERAAGRSTSGRSGGRLAPPAGHRRQRAGRRRPSQLPVLSEPSWTKAGLAAGAAGRFGSCSFSTLNTRSAMGLEAMKSA